MRSALEQSENRASTSDCLDSLRSHQAIVLQFAGRVLSLVSLYKLVIYAQRKQKNFYAFAYRNAVKKFVYENQGLVRRMYGDMRHIFVMQSELENEVDFEDLQHSADKYSKAFNSHNQRQMKAKKSAQERKNFRSDSEPYFRPAQRPSAVNSKQKTKPPRTTSNEASENNVLVDNMIKSNIDAIVGDLRTKEEENLTTAPDVSTGTAKLTSSSSTSSSSLSTTASASSSGSSSKDIDEKVINEATAENVSETTEEDKLALNLFNNISSAMLSTAASSSVSTSSSALDDGKDKVLFTLKNESVNPSALYKLEEEEVGEASLNDLEQVASSVGETFTESTVLDRNSSKEPQTTTTTTTTETQLFQDTVQKEKEPAQVVNRRGV